MSSSMEKGDENTHNIHTMETESEMDTHFHFSEAKHILTRERIGYYCMKIPKAISPIGNCNKKAQREKAG